MRISRPSIPEALQQRIEELRPHGPVDQRQGARIAYAGTVANRVRAIGTSRRAYRMMVGHGAAQRRAAGAGANDRASGP